MLEFIEENDFMNVDIDATEGSIPSSMLDSRYHEPELNRPRIILGEENVDDFRVQSSLAIARKSRYTVGCDDSCEGVSRCCHTLQT